MRLIESDLSKSVKYQVIEYLNDTGYHTYAQRLSNFKFVVGDIVDGEAVGTAWMNSQTGTMAISSGFIETVSPNSDVLTEHCLKQLSVLCRHEMLHYLLAHMFRMEKHLKDKGLSGKVMSIAEANAIGDMDNIAAD